MGWLTWGGSAGSNLERAGIELSTVPEGVSSSTAYMDLYLNFWADATYATNDDQVMNYGGSGIGGSAGFHMTQGARVVASAQVLGQGLSPGGGPTYSWSCNITGHYQGANPSHAISWTLPARPAPTQTIPGAPPVFVDTITSSSARLGIGNPGSDGGAAIDQYHLRLQRNSDAAIIWESEGLGTGWYTIGGLERATGYVIFGRAHNAVGWGTWSGGLGFNTLATVPDKMAAPTITDIAATTATAVYVQPNNGGSAITSYGVQVASDAAFTQNVQLFSRGYISGLVRASTYYVRVRAGNAVGVGEWSNATAFTTLPTVPSAQEPVEVVSIGERSLVAKYKAPSDNGGQAITSYRIEAAEDAAFTQGVLAFTNPGTPGTEMVLSGFKRGRTYYLRTRSANAQGVSAWSATTVVQMLSGASVKVDGTWRPARVWVKVSGSWRPAVIYNKIDGAWVS